MGWEEGDKETLFERFFYKAEVSNLTQILGGFLKILDGLINIVTLGFRGGGFFVEYTFWRDTWEWELEQARQVRLTNLRPTPLTKEEQIEAKRQLEIDDE
jgi:hypothetical protein